MYAKIGTNKNISRTLGYHEQKIIHGKAELLLAANFLKDTEELSRKDKLFHFQRIISLNHRAQKVTLHIFLNFHPDETLSNQKMSTLAEEYMQMAGLGERPYLIYRHNDTIHPHMHVVSTTIKDNGRKMELHNLKFHISDEITKELEIKHSLVKWEGHKNRQAEYASWINAQKIRYGQDPIHPAITNVLNVVIDKYKYTSLSELNAVLRLYNVRALAGRPDSRLYQKKGLLYCALNDKGRTVGQPIKASDFYNNPTLKNLENKFRLNQCLREPHRLRVTTAVDGLFVRQSLDLPAFRAALLQKEQITSVVQKDKSGQPQNIWYIDQKTHCIFDGADLGGRYTIAAIQQRCVSEQAYRQQQQLRQQQDFQQSQRHKRNLHL
jgi:hypothetical protein